MIWIYENIAHFKGEEIQKRGTSAFSITLWLTKVMFIVFPDIQ